MNTNDVRKKIILVDDVKSNLDQGRQILKNQYEVYPALSASKLFEYLEKISPDLILLDIAMPDMNGYEAIKKLKADERWADIPVIFLTAKSDESSEREGFELGGSDYITKPFSAPRLVKRIENQLLIASQKKDLKAALNDAKNASFAKSSFLSNMSHEIRTPMNTILGMTMIAAKTNDVSKLKYCLSSIGSASSHLLNLINDILDISKIEGGKLELEKTSVDIEEILIKVCNLTTEKIEQKDIIFSVSLAPAMRTMFKGDELKLTQVITNLLSNAIKFTPVNGRIELDVREVTRGEDFSVLRFSLKDTGIGMTREQIGRLFTAFEQADSSTVRKFGGTGLGLAISKRIVEKMDGRIWVESEMGKGSEFIFEVRLSYPGDCRNEEMPHISDIKLLIADPDAETRERLRAITATFGITADEACNVTHTAELAANARQANKPYDIIFMNYNLIDGGGEIQYGEENIVVITTFLNWSKNGNTLNGIGIKKFIQKPLFPSLVLKAINSAAGISEDVSQESLNTAEVPDFSGITLLLAEDVEINREIFISLLEETGLKTDTAETGKDAVEKFKQNPDKYSMIIMDVQMPEMDGYEATRTIRSLEYDRAGTIPIIAMTANVFKEDIQKCLDCGMTDHVGKPIEPDVIIKKIAHYNGA